MQLSNLQYGLLGSSSFVGMAVGAFFWGYVSDHTGRQLSFALTVWLTFFGGFFSALAPNYAVLLFLRFTAAFGIGGMLPVDYTVFLEFLPQRHRGSYIVLVDAIGVVPALTLSAAIAWYFARQATADDDGGDRDLEWRWVLVISSVPVGIMAILRRHVPESPRYHLAAGETEAAQRVVQEVADANSVQLPDDWRLLSFQESLEIELATTTTTTPTAVSSPRAAHLPRRRGGKYSSVPSHHHDQPHETEFTSLGSHDEQDRPQQQEDGIVSYHDDDDNDDGVDSLMRNDCHSAAAAADSGHHSFDELVRDPELRGATYRLWMVYFLVQLSSAGMVFALPKLFDQTFVGKSEADIALDLLIGVVGLIPGLAIAFVAVEYSRTKTLASFLFAAAVSVLCLGYAFLVLHSQAWALFFSIVLRGAMEGCFAVLNTTAVESYPTLLRASGLGTAQIFDHVAGAFSPVLFSALNGSQSTRPWVFGIYALAYGFATIPTLGLKEHAAALDY
jgi:MFS family permease